MSTDRIREEPKITDLRQMTQVCTCKYLHSAELGASIFIRSQSLSFSSFYAVENSANNYFDYGRHRLQKWHVGACEMATLNVSGQKMEWPTDELYSLTKTDVTCRTNSLKVTRFSVFNNICRWSIIRHNPKTTTSYFFADTEKW